MSQFQLFGIKVLSLLIAAPFAASSLLYITEKLEFAWKINDKKKKFFALTMLLIFVGVCFGWLL